MTEAEVFERDAEIIRLADERNPDGSFKYIWTEITELIRRKWPLTPLSKPLHNRTCYNAYIERLGYTRERVRDLRRLREAAAG
jgi:hypothetical protein